jgi:type IV pilus assembly protein PilW
MASLMRKFERSSAPGREGGLSLVELMISLTIGLVLLAGITTLIVQQSGTRREMEKSSRQIENGRYATEILRNDIEHAGFYGEYAPPTTALYSAPDPCNMAVNLQGWSAASAAVPVPVLGYAGAAGDPTGCLDNYKANTAVLVVRRTASETIDPGVVSGVNALQVSRCNTDAAQFLMAQGAFNLRQKDCNNLAPAHLYLVRIYYIGTCSTCGAGGDSIPTLRMVENAGASVPLVEGIENMQFEYGIDNVGGRDGAPDFYTNAPAANEWQDVVAVRTHLLSRNNEPTPGYGDPKTYDLGPAAPAVTPAGADRAYKRHVYSQLVRVVNQSGRRETP